MFLETPESIRKSSGMADLARLEAGWRPSEGAYFAAAAGRAFDRTLGMRAKEELGIRAREFFPGLFEDEPPKVYETEEEYQASAHYRKDIPYSRGMSSVRARILAENHERRRERERILAAGDEKGPWWYGPLGFGAGLIGSLPDPVNFLPFAGGAITGARLAGMTARQVAESSLKRGLFEGAAGNLASSAVAAWDLNAKGENITTQEVFLDTAFGAVAGPLFHGAGSFLARRGARGQMRADMRGLIDALDADSPLRAELARSLEGMREGRAEAYAEHGGLPDTLRRMREAVTPAERLELARAMELALHDLTEGRPVDVSPMQETIGRAYDRVLTDPTGGPADEALAVLRSPEFERILLERGPAFFARDGHLIFSGEYIQDTTGFPRSGGGMVKIIWKHGEKSGEAPHLKVTRDDVMRLPEILNEYAPIKQKYERMEWAVRGEDGVNLSIVVGRHKGRENPTVITMVKNDNPKRQLSKKREAPASPSGQGRGHNAGTGDTTAEASSNRVQQGQGLSGETVPAPGGGVKPSAELSPKREAPESSGGHIQPDGGILRLPQDTPAAPSVRQQQGPGLPGETVPAPAGAVKPLDWRAETPETHDPLPLVSKEAGDLLAETGIDPQTGISLEEARLARLDAEGRLAQADKQALLAHAAESERINSLEEAALMVAGRVMGIVQ